jgi:hypothetical protein
MPRPVSRDNFRSLVSVDCPACGRFAAERDLVKQAIAGDRDLACPRRHVLSWRDRLVQRMSGLDKLAKSSLASFNEAIDSVFAQLADHSARVETMRQRLRNLRRRR